MSKERDMRELGRLGGLRSGVVRRRNARLHSIVQKVFKSKFDPTGDFKDILEGMGIDSSEKTDVQTGIITIYAYKALNGDISAARFLIEIGGLGLDSEEKLARIDSLEMLNEQAKGGAVDESDKNVPNLDDIYREAKKLGIYGD